MEPTRPTGYARLAVPEHILRLPTKIHVHYGQIAPVASTSLQTAQTLRTVYAHLAALEHIPLTQMHSFAPLGQLA